MPSNTPTFDSRRKHGAYHGIFNPSEFSKYVSLRTYTPSVELQSFVAHPWIVRWEIPAQQSYIASQILWQPTFNLFVTAEQTFVTGVISGKMSRLFTGSGVYAGIKFRPGSFYPFAKQSASGFTNKLTSASELFPDAELRLCQKALTGSDEEIVEALETLLKDNLPTNDTRVRVGEIIDYIDNHTEPLTVGHIAKHFGFSERTLQHMFKTYVGVSLKWTIMRTRFTAALRQIHETQTIDWLAVAGDLGYSDQSHFIKDFRRVVGMSPGQYENSLGNYTKTDEISTDDSTFFSIT